VNYIPGVFDTRIVDLPTVMYGGDQKVLHQARECVSSVSKAQYLLFTFVCEFEAEHFKSRTSFFGVPYWPCHTLLRTSTKFLYTIWSIKMASSTISGG
jgi:hypothetical protein